MSTTLSPVAIVTKSILLTSVLTTLFPSIAAQTFAITGATNGGVQPRLEIRQLEQIPDQWNLYLLAMQNFKAGNQSSVSGYYQIAGIHGVPNIPWDGVQGSFSNGVGYCTHVSPLFPAWHRAYVALIEQAFMSVVNQTVAQFNGSLQQRYAAAAQNLRLPFWDWAAEPAPGYPVMPYSMTTPNVTLITPTGNQTVPNPLLGYTFNPLNSNDFLVSPWNQWNETYRWPTGTSPTGVSSQESSSAGSIGADSPNLRSRVYNLMTQCNKYLGFSNAESNARSTACQDSLEAIHNNIHADIGGNNGHMTILWYSAFDPSFWLHHTNVDRLFALWQAIYPNAYAINAQTGSGTFAIPNGTQVNGNTFLAPFHRDTNGGQHTSNTVRYTTSLGYTYPELIQGDTSQNGIRAKINALYGSSPSLTTNPGKMKVKARDLNISALSGSLAGLVAPTTHAPNDYVANIACQGFALGGTSTIYLFMGHPASEVPTSWAQDANLIGSHVNFAAPNMMSSTIVTGTVPLTQALVAEMGSGTLSGLTPSVVIPFLKSNLQWRIMKSNGQAVPANDFPGLNIAVQSAQVMPAANLQSFPVWSGWTVHNSITNGKAGGLPFGKTLAGLGGCIEGVGGALTSALGGIL